MLDNFSWKLGSLVAKPKNLSIQESDSDGVGNKETEDTVWNYNYFRCYYYNYYCFLLAIFS